ncbi:hypothetical protein HYY73_06265 [Candidatus Woesearchaeota archaeon]|nr:hypothetical protein [Candidatus Woesearchaeota archaeon]
MPNDFLRALRKEAKYLAAAFVIAAIVLKIAFHREDLLGITKAAASVMWLFVLPGYAIMLHWRENLEVIERLFAGTVAAMAINGIASYYLGLAGLKIQNQTILLPAAIIAASLAWQKFSERKSQQQQSQQGPEQPKA